MFCFKDKTSLPTIIAGKIKPKQWNPNGRNDLALDRDNDLEYEDAIFIPDKQLSRWYNIKVKNLFVRRYRCILASS
jgi:hypothetical protein